VSIGPVAVRLQYESHRTKTAGSAGKGSLLCAMFATTAEVMSAKSCCAAAMGLRYFIANAPMGINGTE
jgi:hypothetical protein